MRVHQRSRLSPRPAFTLVELMVVILIVGILAALTILIFPRLQDSQRVAKGGDVVQGQLFLARQMALRDQVPRGVRLIQDPSDSLVHSLQLIEQPAPYAVGQVLTITIAGSGSTAVATVAFGPSSTGVPNFGDPAAASSNWTVQPGDYLDLSAAGDSYSTVSPHAMHLIATVNPATSTLTLWPGSLPSVSAAPVYRIVRSPRPAIGINPVALPTDVVVDCPLAPSHPALGTSQGLPPSGNQDILFDPSGKVLGVAGTNGKVILWVYDWTTGVKGTPPVPVSPTPGTPEQTLVAVFTRTGSVVAQPVNVSGPDPYSFVKDGSTSGM